jgi:hypothetical protein
VSLALRTEVPHSSRTLTVMSGQGVRSRADFTKFRDGSDSHEIELTHEFLAMMLCVRRPGVTVATHILEGQGTIRAKRGRITILDRPKLVDLAGDCYGLAEAEYERVIMPKIREEELRRLCEPHSASRGATYAPIDCDPKIHPAVPGQPSNAAHS